MFGLTLSGISLLCNGKLINCEKPETEPCRNVIDSRDVKNGDIFAALEGDRVDGHDYISAAANSGACCSLAERIPDNFEGCLILVDSVEKAIADISENFRKTLAIPVVGITGSNGKTTAKEIISCVLSERFNTLKTEKNFNNQLGVPMTVSSIFQNHEAAVIEMGVSKKHDMELLGRIVRPDIMVFTNIGHAHLEFLDNLEGVLYEKAKVLNYLDSDAVIIINGDDPYLRKIECPQRIISYGTDNFSDIWADNIEYSVSENETCMDIHLDGNILKVSVPSYGRHMVYAVLEAVAAGTAIGLTNEEIFSGIKKYRPVGRRSLLCRTQSFILVDDCYNSNPDSLKNSMESMMAISGRHVCILGDMLELGENSAALHYDTGEYARKTGIDLVISVGSLAKYISDGAGDIGIHFSDMNELFEALPGILKKDDVILVKASRGMHFENISEYIKTL